MPHHFKGARRIAAADRGIRIETGLTGSREIIGRRKNDIPDHLLHGAQNPAIGGRSAEPP